MKHLKMLALAASSAIALMAIGAGSASATTLEIGGSRASSTVEFAASAEGSIKWEKTDHTFLSTCTVATFAGKTSVFTGTVVSGPLSSLTFSTCTTEKVVVDAPGSLSIENISGTTNGTVQSSNAKWTLPSPFGTLTCETSAGNDIGTLTGVPKTTEHATLDIKAILNCGFLAPSLLWEGAYRMTTPTGLGVTS